jgi:uncharacterized transporter YbjL
MAVSRDTGHRPDGKSVEQFAGQLSRYDLLLTAIPLVLGLGLLVGTLSTVPFHLGVAVGAVVSALLVADAVYFHPPTESAPRPPATNSD